jgi:hypothetical protein
VSWQTIEGVGNVATRGTFDGLPVLAWGWAPRELLATMRQLRKMGLRPGGADPVAALRFQHRKPAKANDFALLYLITRAVPKRTATARQHVAIESALRARRTCRECRRVQDFYLSTISRMCSSCEDRTDFWAQYAADHGYTWEVAA